MASAARRAAEADVNPAKPFRSILFEHPGDEVQHEDPSMFRDLNLDRVFAAVASGRDDYDLMPFFAAPLRDVRAVGYRHEIQQDLADDALAKAVADFALAMHEMRENLGLAGRLRERYSKERWFLDAARVYCAAVTALADALTAIDPGSRGFAGFRQYLAGYTQSEAFARLAADIARVTSALDEVRYCVLIKANRVRVTKYEGEADHSAEVQRTFAKFAERTVKDYRVGFRGRAEMDHVEARIADLVARLYPEAFQALDDFCSGHSGYLDETIRGFDREVQFYAAYRDFIAPMKAAGLEFCYPVVSAGAKEVSVRAAFDLALAAKLMPKAGAMVRNDFHLTGAERIFVVTGPNHGGKTTFARMVGQLYYLASLGYPVPAGAAALFLPDRVFTHFEREEDLATRRGKFEDELVRIKGVLDEATGDSVLVMNESFASTTLRDATIVGERVLDRMTALGLLGVYVTFVDELASRNAACVSMVGTVVPDNPAERTLKIVRKPADGLAYAAAIAGKYRLTYRQLKERLA
jgi:DNA mismatch repair protein MutS